MNDTPDPAERFLVPSPGPAPDAAFREALLRRTTRALRGRKRFRRFAVAAAAVAACFAVAAVAPRFVSPPAPPPTSEGPAAAHPAGPDADPPALVLEWRAFDRPEQRADLYRRAGDLYAREEHDLEAAVRCYGNALDAGTDADLEIKPEDDWLLMAIKDARQKEKRHAKRGS